MPKPKDPCKVFACRIQSCLKGKQYSRNQLNHTVTYRLFFVSENDFKEERCLDVLEDMRECCLLHQRESLCCSGIKLDKIYKNRSNKQDKNQSNESTNSTKTSTN